MSSHIAEDIKDAMKNADCLASMFMDYARNRFGSDFEFDSCEKLPQSGGNRQYFRLKGHYPDDIVASRDTLECRPEAFGAIGVIADNLADSRAFLSLSRIFGEMGVNVPEIYQASKEENLYLQQDLGSQSLLDVIMGEANYEKYVKASLRMLAKMQTLRKYDWEEAVAYAPFSERLAMWDLNYFKYEFLKVAGVEFDENKLEDDFIRFAAALSKPDESTWGFMMRDCQSRNVMIYEGLPYFIDYQGGRFGPCIYDAVSFLWQAKAGFSSEFRRKMLEVYADSFASYRTVEKSHLLARVNEFVAFRTLQVLGAYGFRGLIEKRSHFIESIPGALANLADVLTTGVLDSYPELKRVCMACVKLHRFENCAEKSPLIVKVQSFSFKKGYPEDDSGNGGGFVFDCRGMHNPGRYDEYKKLTGRQAPVINFLKAVGETDKFAANAYELVKPTVANYIERGFSSLQISFGCTGGQHRSVYCADRMAEYIKKNFPNVVVHLFHREQNIFETL